MTRIAVLTSLYGDYDQPVRPAWQDRSADWLLVSDREHDCWPWKTIVEPRPSLHPRLAAKVAKTRPDRYAPDADILIWVDASIAIAASDFLDWCVRGLGVRGLGGADLAQIVHPERHAIAPEAEVSATMVKYAGLPVREQVAAYQAEGFPEVGLWATGLIVYRNGGWLAPFGDAWLAEQVRWTYQDQLSEPYVLWKHGFVPAELPGPLWGNRRFAFRPHASDR